MKNFKAKKYVGLMLLALPILGMNANAGPTQTTPLVKVIPAINNSNRQASNDDILPTLLASMLYNAGEEQESDYPVNFDKDATYTHESRRIASVSLQGSDGNKQTATVDNSTKAKVYQPRLDVVFSAKAGEKVTPTFGFSGNWMNGFVYIDRGHDGQFDATLNDDKTPAEGSDVMAFSYISTEGNKGVNSNGGTLGNGNVLNPPAFVVPADLEPGYYRMRYKVDWSDIDPAGSKTVGNDIIKNGGGIVDVLLDVHGDECNLLVESKNGSLTLADGTALTDYKAKYGQALEIIEKAEEGYVFDGLTIRHGYNLKGDSIANHGIPQYKDEHIPAYLFRDGKYTIPAEYLTGGEAMLIGRFVKSQATEGKDYATNFPEGQEMTRTDRKVTRIALNTTSGGNTNLMPSAESNKVYRPLSEAGKVVSAQPGDNVTVKLTGAKGLHSYLYIDYNMDGMFNNSLSSDGKPTMSGELVAYNFLNGKNSNGETVAADAEELGIPSFSISENLPTGVYRARLKVDNNDANPGGKWAEGAEGNIDAEGGMIVDFLINVHNTTHDLILETRNGSIYGLNNVALPMTVTPFGGSISLVPTPVFKDYEATEMTIRHGLNLDGPQYIHGNRQWAEYTVPAKAYTMPKDSIDGDVVATVNFVPGSKVDYLLTFSDEFDAPDGSQPDNSKWVRCPRQNATWNRWVSNSNKVVYIKDGKLVCHAMPNPDKSTDNVPMITGGVQSSGKYDFKYGRVEARMKTDPHVGNFPAFWMMPTDQTGGWPVCGEIDIFEVINSENKAYQTIHSNWTWNLNHKNEPQSSSNVTALMDRYHTYGFEWDSKQLRWYVDGKQVFKYDKSTDESILKQGYWPFDKEFYIILNQSVGDNNAWASYPDVNHTYTSRFDWVRVYLPAEQTGINEVDSSNESAIEVQTSAGTITLNGNANQASVYDISGRKLFSGSVSGTKTISVPKGIYIVEGKKYLVP